MNLSISKLSSRFASHNFTGTYLNFRFKFKDYKNKREYYFLLVCIYYPLIHFGYKVQHNLYQFWVISFRQLLEAFNVHKDVGKK